MSEPRWLTTAMVRALQDESIERFGGLPGVRDAGLLESALARPRNPLAYEDETDLCALAAAYGVGLARNHAFLDGNKRICVLAVAVFLALNGRRFDPEEADEVSVVLALAAGEIDEAGFAAWVRSNAQR